MPSEIAEIGLATCRARQHDLVVLGVDFDRLGDQRVEVEAELRQHQQRHQRRAEEQQARLDDLHPGGGDHAAESDVDDHQDADEHDRVEVRQAEQQLDQLPGADHLRDQVEGDGHQRAGGGHRADRRRLQAIGGDVGEGEAAEIAQRLGHQEHDDRPAHEEADRIDQAVIAGAEHQRRNAEERGRRHVVAGDRQAVLQAGDAAAGGVEVLGRAGALGRPVGDAQRQNDEGGEDDERVPIRRRRRRGAPAVGGVRRAGEQRQRRPESARLDETVHCLPPTALALTIALVRSSYCAFARRT